MLSWSNLRRWMYCIHRRRGGGVLEVVLPTLPAEPSMYVARSPSTATIVALPPLPPPRFPYCHARFISCHHSGNPWRWKHVSVCASTLHGGSVLACFCHPLVSDLVEVWSPVEGMVDFSRRLQVQWRFPLVQSLVKHFVVPILSSHHSICFPDGW